MCNFASLLVVVSLASRLRYHTRIRDRNVQCAITRHRNSWLILELAVSRLRSISFARCNRRVHCCLVLPCFHWCFFFLIFCYKKKTIQLAIQLPIHEKRRAANVSRTTNVQQWTCSKNRRRIRFARQVSSDTSMEPISTYLYIASEAC